MMLDIPADVTDEQIDREILTFSRSHQPYQRKCKQQIVNFVCAIKYPSCQYHTPKKIWKRVPLCRESCQLAKDKALCRDAKTFIPLPWKMELFIGVQNCNILPKYQSPNSNCRPFSFLSRKSFTN